MDQLVPEVRNLIFPESLNPTGDVDSDAEYRLGIEELNIIIYLYM